jgi:hypothetical protein
MDKQDEVGGGWRLACTSPAGPAALRWRGAALLAHPPAAMPARGCGPGAEQLAVGDCCRPGVPGQIEGWGWGGCWGRGGPRPLLQAGGAAWGIPRQARHPLHACLPARAPQEACCLRRRWSAPSAPWRPPAARRWRRASSRTTCSWRRPTGCGAARGRRAAPPPPPGWPASAAWARRRWSSWQRCGRSSRPCSQTSGARACLPPWAARGGGRVQGGSAAWAGPCSALVMSEEGGGGAGRRGAGWPGCGCLQCTRRWLVGSAAAPSPAAVGMQPPLKPTTQRPPPRAASGSCGRRRGRPPARRAAASRPGWTTPSSPSTATAASPPSSRRPCAQPAAPATRPARRPRCLLPARPLPPVLPAAPPGTPAHTSRAPATAPATAPAAAPA